jgi:hypothetical protein
VSDPVFNDDVARPTRTTAPWSALHIKAGTCHDAR